MFWKKRLPITLKILSSPGYVQKQLGGERYWAQRGEKWIIQNIGFAPYGTQHSEQMNPDGVIERLG